MSEDQSIPQIIRFAAIPRETVDGTLVVQIILELRSETGHVTRPTGMIPPEDAIPNGTALATLGRKLLQQQASN